MEARWKELLEQDITKGLNMEISEEELLGAPTACKIAASPVVASVTVKEAEVFCKINTDDKKYLDIRSEEFKEIIPPVCKTTGAYSDNLLACETAEATQPSIGKRMDMVTQHFGEEEDPRYMNQIQHPEMDELENLERQARWHSREASRYSEMVDQWRQKYQLH